MSAPIRTLTEALLAGRHLAVEAGGRSFPLGGIAWLGNRTAFVTQGWDAPGYSGHPFHILDGIVDPRGSGPWVGAGVAIVEADEDHPLIWDFINWRTTHKADWQQVIQRGCKECTDLLVRQQKS